MSEARRGALLAAALYLGVAAFANRAVLADPFTLLPTPTDFIEAEKPGRRLAYEADQRFVVSQVTRLARAFSSDPTRVTDIGLCAPLRHPHTLGEHMFAQGLLGALPYAATGDPLFTFNMVSVLTTWISLMCLYALAYYWTGSFAAAFIAGLLFGLHPQRLNNPAHLFGFGNGWSAIALLAAHRLFDRERWADAALLAAALCLQLLESFYPVLGLGIVGGTYGLWLSVEYAGRLPRLLPKLATAATIVGVFAWLVLGPYLETQAAWGVLEGRQRLLVWPWQYLPGGTASLGWVLLVLVLLSLVDRLRGPRVRDDPRWPLLLAGILVFWCSVWAIRLPFGLRVTSPLLLLGPYIPGIDAVRALSALQYEVFLVASIIAAFAIVAILERVPRRAREGVAVLIAAATIAQTFYPPAARATFTLTPDLTAFPMRPPDHELAALDRLPPGAVLDLPIGFEPAEKLRWMPKYLLAAAYYDQPTAACYNSFLSGLQSEIERLARALPSRAAARELSALGFGSLRIHRGDIGPRGRLLAPLLFDEAYAEPIDVTPATALFRLRPHPFTREFAAIASPAPPPARASVERPADDLVFRFERSEEPTFRHPDPIEPSEVLVRWRTQDGALVSETHARALLPPALASGRTSDRTVRVDAPAEAGLYRAELARAAEPGLVLASRLVEVR